MAGHYAGGEAAYPGREAKELGEIALHQPEGGVEFAVRVADVNGALQAIPVEIALRNIIGGHMHEDDPGTLFFDAGALFGDIGQCFPAEGTSEVAQEDQKYRLPKGIIKKRFTGIQYHLVQQLFIQLFGFDHVVANFGSLTIASTQTVKQR